MSSRNMVIQSSQEDAQDHHLVRKSALVATKHL